MSDLDRLLAQASSLSVSSPVAPRRPSPSRPASPVAPGGGGLVMGTSGLSGAGGGRFGRGMTSSKLYSVIGIQASDSSVCFGSVGVGNASFCIRKGCTVKAHSETKVQPWVGLSSNRVFIVRAPGSTVFLEPSVAEDQVPPELLADWKQQHQEWKSQFLEVLTPEQRAKLKC